MWNVYVLECEDGCYYVGIALDVDKRFKQHCEGGKNGAWFTREHRPIRIVEQVCCGELQKDAVKAENKKTLEYAYKHGYRQVYGGKYEPQYKLKRALSGYQPSAKGNLP